MEPMNGEAAGELAAPMAVEGVTEQTVATPTAAEQRADAKGRVGNTVTQVGLPTALVTIGTWCAALGHVDLDPGPGSDMPAVVVGAFVFVITWAMARWMNREGYRATDDAE